MIITQKIKLDEVKAMAKATFGDLVKAVVDVDREIIAVDAELHSDLEALLLADGSTQNNLWGINVDPEKLGEAVIEFDSMIILRPSQNNNSRGVEDIQVRKKIIEIVGKRIIR